jgi:hypothetical protein
LTTQKSSFRGRSKRGRCFHQPNTCPLLFLLDQLGTLATGDVLGCATFHHNTLWQEYQIHAVKLLRIGFYSTPLRRSPQTKRLPHPFAHKHNKTIRDAATEKCYHRAVIISVERPFAFETRKSKTAARYMSARHALVVSGDRGYAMQFVLPRIRFSNFTLRVRFEKNRSFLQTLNQRRNARGSCNSY